QKGTFEHESLQWRAGLTRIEIEEVRQLARGNFGGCPLAVAGKRNEDRIPGNPRALLQALPVWVVVLRRRRLVVGHDERGDLTALGRNPLGRLEGLGHLRPRVGYSRIPGRVETVLIDLPHRRGHRSGSRGRL